MMYAPDKWTDEELETLEKRIAEVYKQAEKDLNKEVKEYFAKFALRDKEMQQLVQSGDMSKADYQQWRLTQIGRGKRFEALRDKVAERYTQANEVTTAYINDVTPSIYSLNRNYEAYTIEKTVGVCDFTMFDEATVRKLLVEQPDVMPYYPPDRALQRGIDLAYGKEQITKHITSGIIRGLPVGKLANELMSSVTDMNRTSAVRAARTGVTAAQNGGRFDSYIAAEKMGITIKKRWIATKDARTRFGHGMADGQTKPLKEPFIVDGEELMFPADKSMGAHGWNIYNCRCSMRTVEKDGIEAEPRQMRVRDPVTGENVLVNEMTYKEWAEWKKTGQKPIAKPKSSDIITANLNSETQTFLKTMENRGIGNNPVTLHQKPLTETEIVKAISGGDMTKGSCASVAMAYCGQKQGWNVLDFRGGDSLDFFSSKLNKIKMFKAVGASSIVEDTAKSNLTNGKRILKRLEEGKEYYLSCGRHAAIVRNNGGVMQYLELQSNFADRNGWNDFGDIGDILKYRFGCSSSSRYYATVYATDISQLDNDEFRAILGYINTNPTQQKKGASGSAK